MKKILSSHTEKQVVELTRGVGSYGYIPQNAGTAGLNASLHMAFQLAQANARLREREAVLAISERKYRTLFESMQEGFALHEAVRNRPHGHANRPGRGSSDDPGGGP